MRESRAEGDVIADIAAEELQAYLGNHPTTQLINHTTRQQANLPTISLYNIQIYKHRQVPKSGYKTIQTSRHPYIQPYRHLAIQLSGHPIIKPLKCQTVQLSSCPTISLSTSHLSNHQIFQPSKHQFNGPWTSANAAIQPYNHLNLQRFGYLTI
jgi:hypothetical protein